MGQAAGTGQGELGAGYRLWFRGKFNPGEAGAGLSGGIRGEKEEDRVRRALPADSTRGVSCKESWGAEGASTWLSSVLSLCCPTGSGYICTLQQSCALPCTPEQPSQQGLPHRSDLPKGTSLESPHKSTAHFWSTFMSLPNTR